MVTGVTGALGSLRYKIESSFAGGTSDASPKVFGRGQRITSLSRNENLEPVYELGQRTISYGAFKQTEGTMGLEWVLSNPWFFFPLLGGVNGTTTGVSATGTGTNPTVHGFTSAKRLPTFQTEVAVDLGATGGSDNVTRTFKGCVLNQVTMTAAVGELVKCRADAIFAKEATVATSFADQPVELLAAGGTTYLSNEPYSFVHAGVSDGSSIAEVQSIELTINNNAQLLWGLGNGSGTDGANFAVNAYAQALDLTGRLSVTFKSGADITALRSRSATYSITISNGLTAGDERTITISGSGFLRSEHSMNIEPNALVLQDVSLRFENISVAAKHKVTTYPI